MRASKLIGSGVYDPSDQKIGNVEELDAVMGLRQNPWRGDCPPE